MDVIKKKVALPVPAHFVGMDHQLEDMQVAVIRAGLPEQDKRRRKEMRFIECFHSRGQHLWKFIGTKENVCIRKEFNSQRIGLGHQHGRRFIVLGHQYGRRDVM